MRSGKMAALGAALLCAGCGGAIMMAGMAHPLERSGLCRRYTAATQSLFQLVQLVTIHSIA